MMGCQIYFRDGGQVVRSHHPVNLVFFTSVHQFTLFNTYDVGVILGVFSGCQVI